MRGLERRATRESESIGTSAVAVLAKEFRGGFARSNAIGVAQGTRYGRNAIRRIRGAESKA